MTDSFKLRTFAGWSILLLGALSLVTSFLPVISRGTFSPAAGMIALFGLLALGVGLPLSTATGPRLTEAAARNLCLLLEVLTFGAAGGIVGCSLQHPSFFELLDPLRATLAIVFVALLGAAALARIAIARQAAAAFRSSGGSLLSYGGSMDPATFLVLQPALVVVAAVLGRMIAAQAGQSSEASVLALALAVAALPALLRAELALCLKRWRDHSAAWPAYGVLAWAAVLGLVAFPELPRWAVALPGVLLGSPPPTSWPQVSLTRAVCYLLSLTACISCYLASRRERRAPLFRIPGYAALALGSYLPVSAGLASDGVPAGSPIPVPVMLAVAIVLPAAVVMGAHRLLFRSPEKRAESIPVETCLAVTDPAPAEA